MHKLDKYKTLELMANFVSYLPDNFLRSMETISQIAQGKGGGGFSIKREIKAVNQLKNRLGLEYCVVADIGANLGLWTLEYLESNPNDYVFAFEPSKAAFQQLTRNLQNYQKIHLENIGLSASEGDAFLYAVEPASGGASMVQRKHSINPQALGEKIRVTTISNYFDGQPQDQWPNIMKIDCEGAEFEILRGSEKLMNSLRILQFEFASNAIDFGYYFLDIYKFLTSHGFEIYRLTPRGLQQIRKYDYRDETFSVTNFFAVK